MHEHASTLLTYIQNQLRNGLLQLISWNKEKKTVAATQ